MHYVYIVQCTDQTLYTGWTTDIEKRLTAHNEGRGAKRTKGRGPVVLMYLETFEDKGAALRREMAIKKLSRQQKIQLIKESHLDSPL
ncbi:MAG: GIY-YIG nuclease family protein [Anaerovoracaceae bacterium]|jgi:putative endonuclease